MSGQTSIKVSSEILQLIKECEEEYRSHHPEFNCVPLARNKILYEVCKFYLK